MRCNFTSFQMLLVLIPYIKYLFFNGHIKTHMLLFELVIDRTTRTLGLSPAKSAGSLHCHLLQHYPLWRFSGSPWLAKAGFSPKPSFQSQVEMNSRLRLAGESKVFPFLLEVCHNKQRWQLRHGQALVISPHQLQGAYFLGSLTSNTGLSQPTPQLKPV